ncbi:MAG: hypothetical protein ACH0QD_04600 [Tepidibacillus sp.]
MIYELEINYDNKEALQIFKRNPEVVQDFLFVLRIPRADFWFWEEFLTHWLHVSVDSIKRFHQMKDEDNLRWWLQGAELYNALLLTLANFKKENEDNNNDFLLPTNKLMAIFIGLFLFYYKNELEDVEEKKDTYSLADFYAFRFLVEKGVEKHLDLYATLIFLTAKNMDEDYANSLKNVYLHSLLGYSRNKK